MKQNILKGMVLIGAIALSSCSTQNKLAVTKPADDDVYFTQAKAGDEPVYAVRQNYRQDDYDDSNGYSGYDDDYYYYDSYAARLNRFYNYSPFLSSYYDGLYYGGCTPYYSGFSLGFGLGYGNYGGGYFGYNPYTYYGYNPYWGYSNYGYYGSTIGYGVSPYWGAYSYYNVARNYNNPRPYRGSGLQTVGGINSMRGNRGTVSYGNANSSYLPNRPTRGTVAVGPNGVINNGNNGYARPTRSSQPMQQVQRQQPQYQPQPQIQSAPQSSGSSSSGSSSGGGGGGRPVRP